MTERTLKIAAHLSKARAHLSSKPPRLIVEGQLTRMVGLTLEASGCRATVGGRCIVYSDEQHALECEVVGFAAEHLYLMPIGPLRGIAPAARVVPTGGMAHAWVGENLLGRVINGQGAVLDGGPKLNKLVSVSLHGHAINPLLRQPIRQPLDVGVRSINALFTVGKGQRLGLFAGSGVGKSVLLGMMTRFTTADVIVVALIGERGREVQEFIDSTLGKAGLARAVVVASPADTSPLERMNGAALATSIAEYFRDKGRHVLFLMDSLTRYAQAQREIALAIGEPPATKGYPPSAFAKLPQLVERAGNGQSGKGSITAFYTVLTEGDDLQDPIADAARAILDGHIVLSRGLAESGHYPSIDVEASISRAMTEITSKEHQRSAQQLRQLYSAYQRNQDLINLGAYVPGSDPIVDAAISLHPDIKAFLAQDMHTAVNLEKSKQALLQLINKKQKA